MAFTEYLIPTLISVTTAYAAIVFYFFKKSKENEMQIKKVGSDVKQASVDTNTKVSELSKNFDEEIVPSLKSLELEIKNINCRFSAELVLEKLQSNDNYPKAKLISDNKIITGVKISDEDGDEGSDEEGLMVGHMITLELESSSILIESYCLTIKDPSSKVYEEILKENANLKVSDFGIQTLNDVTFVIAQAYLVYPKESFHITPFIEALDHLEHAQISLRDKFKALGSSYKNISLTDYIEHKVAHDKAMIESS